MQRLSRKLTLGVALLGGSIAAQTAAAGEGYFAGFGVPSLSLEGDFDGESRGGSTQSAEIVPRWDETTGYRLTGGLRDETYYYVGSYVQADLDGVWRGFAFSGKYRSIFGEAGYLFLRENIRPYIGAGIGLSRVDVNDGSGIGLSVDVTDGSIDISDGPDGVVADSRFSGDVKYRLLAGVLFDIGRELSLDLQVSDMFGEYSDYQGISEGELAGFDADGTSVSLSIQYYFGY